MNNQYSPFFILRGLMLAALFMIAQSVWAVTTEDGGDLPPVSSIQTVTVNVPDEGSPEITQGTISSQMIDTVVSIVNAFSSEGFEPCPDAPNEQCFNMGSEGAPLYLTCEYGDTSKSCLLNVGDSTPLEISCTDYQDESGHGKTCTVTTDTQSVTEQLALLPDSNLGQVANGFLNCLNGAYGSSEATCAGLVSALQDGDMDLAQQYLQSLTPLNPEAAGDLARDNLRNSTNVVLNRLGQIRQNNTLASNIQSSLFFANNQWLASGTKLAANDSLASDVTPTDVTTSIAQMGKLGFFINMNITDGKYKDGSLASSSDFTSSMLTLGFDYRVRDDLVTGLAFNIGQSKTKFQTDVNGELTSDSFSFIVYNSFYKKNWYLDTALTIGGDSYEQNRKTTGGAKYDTDFHSMQYKLSATVGYDFYIQSFSISPFFLVDFGRLDIDSYNEVQTGVCGGGACGSALNMDSQKRDLGSLQVGSRFRYIATTSKGVFIPSLSLTIVNDYKNKAQQVTGRFIGIAGSNFTVKTAESDASYGIIGLGFSFQLKNGNSGFLNLENLQGYDNLKQNRLTLGWRWEL